MRIAIMTAAFVTGGCIGGITGTGEPGGAQADAAVRQPDATTVDIREQFAKWSGCMTIENFQAANMATAWGSLTANDGRLCRNCHSDGAFGFIATTDDAAFFAGLSQQITLMAVYFRIDATVTPPKMVVNTLSFESADRRPGHPRFNATNNAGLSALGAFHAATAANTACGPSKLVN